MSANNCLRLDRGCVAAMYMSFDVKLIVRWFFVFFFRFIFSAGLSGMADASLAKWSHPVIDLSHLISAKWSPSGPNQVISCKMPHPSQLSQVVSAGWTKSRYPSQVISPKWSQPKWSPPSDLAYNWAIPARSPQSGGINQAISAMVSQLRDLSQLIATPWSQPSYPLRVREWHLSKWCQTKYPRPMASMKWCVKAVWGLTHVSFIIWLSNYSLSPTATPIGFEAWE